MAMEIKKQKESFNFYESFSDMLFNTLVLFLVLIVGLIVLASNEAAKYKEKSKGLDEKLAEIEQRVKTLRGEETALKFERDKVRDEKERIEKENTRLTQMKEDLDETISEQTATLRSQAQEADERAEKLKQALAAFVGMKGKMKNVVILVDLSGSMVLKKVNGQYVEDDDLKERFSRVLKEVCNMVQHLDFESFSVIGFGGERRGAATRIEKIGDSLMLANDSNRKNAAARISEWQAYGGTPTRTALAAAFDLGNVDTILLYSDGAPSDSVGEVTEAEKLEVLKLCRSRNPSKKFTINTIAVGAYDDRSADQTSFVQFMRTLATENGGAYSAR